MPFPASAGAPAVIGVEVEVMPGFIPRAGEVRLRARGCVVDGVKWRTFGVEVFRVVE
jgi:hypothetical protein